MLKNTLLTKSRYLIGLQCPKYLWIKLNNPDKIPEEGLSTKYKFEQGKLVGEYAKKLFPEGSNIPTDVFKDNLETTIEFLEHRKPLFEAGILFEKYFSRIDILKPVEDDQWDIIEVKSSGEIKDHYIDDVSFQKYCCESFGLKIRNCFLMYINREYVRDGAIEPEKLLQCEDITSRVNEKSQGIQQRINEMLEVIRSRACPDISISNACKKPYECPLKKECWSFLPSGNVFELYYGRKCFELFNDGIACLRDIPNNFKLSDKQQIQKKCAISKEVHINKESIKQFLITLQYPLYYFDFETYASVIPFFNGTKANQKIPFQFSLHTIQENGAIEHNSFLADTKEDPRLEILNKMQQVLGNTGSIIVYHQSFEIGRLKELAQDFPDFEMWVKSVLARIVDLEAPFKNFYYYNPVQLGSASIKKVMPALIGKGYENMNINNGEDAYIQFLNITFGDVSQDEKQQARNSLEEYCCLDTEGMVWIIDELAMLCKSN